MKNLKTSTIYTAFIMMLLGLFSINAASAQGYDDVDFDVFHEELDPYGDWDHDDEYGDVWYPDEDDDFRPYGTNGYWTMTEYGNTWVSNYDWGWAPFHYGRWIHRPHRGWAWVPGYEWGPAWVDWRSGGGYYGWAPMRPGISVNVSLGIPLDLWVFIPTTRIYDRYMNRHWSYGRRNIYNNTTIINNTYIVNNNRYYGGPARRDIERHIGRRVDVRNVNFDNRRGASRVSRSSVSMYRPDRNNRSDRAANSRSGRLENNRNARSSDRSPANRVENRSGRSQSGRSNSDYRITRNANGQREMHIGNGNSNRSNREATNNSRSGRVERGNTNSRDRQPSSRGKVSMDRSSSRNETMNRSSRSTRN
ncbi:DUF6600 domain-containing protein, partial [Sphingobacterium mizutaii]